MKIINLWGVFFLCFFLKNKSILIKHESCLSVCVSVHVFRSRQKSQAHEILALGLIWAILDHYELLIFKGGSPYGPVFYCRSDKSKSVLICFVFGSIVLCRLKYSNRGNEIRAEGNKRTSPPTALDVCGPVN